MNLATNPKVSIAQVTPRIWRVTIDGKPSGKPHTREGALTAAKLLVSANSNLTLEV